MTNKKWMDSVITTMIMHWGRLTTQQNTGDSAQGNIKVTDTKSKFGASNISVIDAIKSALPKHPCNKKVRPHW